MGAVLPDDDAGLLFFVTDPKSVLEEVPEFFLYFNFQKEILTRNFFCCIFKKTQKLTKDLLLYSFVIDLSLVMSTKSFSFGRK